MYYYVVLIAIAINFCLFSCFFATLEKKICKISNSCKESYNKLHMCNSLRSILRIFWPKE